MSKLRRISTTELKLREYELMKYAMYNQGERVACQKWYDELDSVVLDSDYQREAIKLEKNDMGLTMFRGGLTPSIMLSNYEFIDSEILQTLLDKVLFEYIDKERNECLMHVKDCFGLSYLAYIVIMTEISFDIKLQERITQGILIQYEKELDLDVISCFLANDAIELRYKQQVIDKMSEEDLSELLDEFESDSEAMLDFLTEYDDIEMDDEEYDYEEEEELLDITEVIDYIMQKIGK